MDRPGESGSNTGRDPSIRRRLDESDGDRVTVSLPLVGCDRGDNGKYNVSNNHHRQQYDADENADGCGSNEGCDQDGQLKIESPGAFLFARGTSRLLMDPSLMFTDSDE